jgi:NADH-quinone oxidoreductase subunit A
MKIMYDYFYIFIFFIFSAIITMIIFLLSYLFATQNPDIEKTSPYECGFEPFDDARKEVDVRFYLVAILFIIFDVEAAYLYPWAISLFHLNAAGYWAMVDFVIELVVGLYYVWKIGALEWE